MFRFNLQPINHYCKLISLFTFTVSLIIPIALSGAEFSPPKSILVENFSPGSEKDKIPDGWRPTQKDLSMFSFGKEGDNYYTTVSSNRSCNSIGKQFSCSPKEYPFLSWKWRVHKLPEGGSELKKQKNDSGAGIYVIFKGFFKLNRIIKYVWSSSLPVGTLTSSPYNKNTKIVVLESGSAKTDQWIIEHVNVFDDYKRLFGENPPDIEAFGILTDSDNTKSSALADYDDIIISQSSTIASSR
jgi:hypothetical protein